MKAIRQSPRQHLMLTSTLISTVLILVSLACSAIAVPATEIPVGASPPAEVTVTPAPSQEEAPQAPAEPGGEADAPISLAEAIQQNVADIQILGTGAASGNSMIIAVRRTGDRLATIRVEPGTVLVSSVKNEQDMVVRRLLGWRTGESTYKPTEGMITLYGPKDMVQDYAVEAYCLNFHKDNPSPTTTFSIGGTPPAEALAVLDAVEQLPAAGKDIVAVQAAIWAVTDNVSQEALASRGYAADQELVQFILQTAGLDPTNYALLGGEVAVVSDTPEPPDATPGMWQPMPDLPRYINALVVDPHRPQVLYAGTGLSGAGSGVYRSEGGGLSWQRASEGLPSEDVRALAFSGTESTTLYAAAGHRGDVFASTDGAASWTRLGTYALTGSKAQLAVAPSNGDVLFVAEDVRGLYRSLDGGRNWVEAGEGLPKDEHGIAYVQSVAVDPADANIAYAGTGMRATNGNGVYKSTDGGEAWAPANRGIIDYGITALAVNPLDSQVVYAGGTNGELFKSTDGGANWDELTGQLPIENSFHQRILDIFIDPEATETLYLLHERVGVLRSTDGGAQWRLLGSPAEVTYPTFTAMAVIFSAPNDGNQPIVLAGIREQGGWCYAAE